MERAELQRRVWLEIAKEVGKTRATEIMGVNLDAPNPGPLPNQMTLPGLRSETTCHTLVRSRTKRPNQYYDHRYCSHCGRQYVTARTHSHTCSNKCRKAKSREAASLEARGLQYRQKFYEHSGAPVHYG